MRPHSFLNLLSAAALIHTTKCSSCAAGLPTLQSISGIYSFIHYTLSNPQIRCVAANILWQPSSLCHGIFSTM